MAEKKQFNLKNPAVKRILQEVKEMQRDPSKEYMSMPIEEDIFEWQFAIHGPQDTEFEGGIYHGRIILPAEYPFKPPAFMLLTPSGRFEVLTKICLSISQHHPEHWQPSWSVRTALVALIAFLPTKPDGALGSLDYTKEERRALAIKSREAPPKFGSGNRQQVINQIHEQMLLTAPPVPPLRTESVSEENAEEKNCESDSQEHDHYNPNIETNGSVDPLAIALGAHPANATIGSSSSPPSLPPSTTGLSRLPSQTSGPSSSSQAQVNEATTHCEGRYEAAACSPATDSAEPRSVQSPNMVTVAPKKSQNSAEDGYLTQLAVALVVAIVALLVRKFIRAYFDAGAVDPQGD